MESTRITLRLPAPLASEAATLAQAMGISLNAFLTLAVRNWTSYQRRSLGTPPPKGPADVSTKGTLDKSDALPKVGRNEPCPCGSGLKYKRCHGQ